jgi:ElaB/YqjD/DUF883 family membrane-anchored ribosome-binding protein
MNMADEMTQIEDDLDEARAELHQTLEQVNQKVEAIGTRLIHPENVLRLHPVLSICLAGAAGFAAGSARSRRRIFGAFATGLLVGFIVKRRASHEDSHHG